MVVNHARVWLAEERRLLLRRRRRGKGLRDVEHNRALLLRLRRQREGRSRRCELLRRRRVHRSMLLHHVLRYRRHEVLLRQLCVEWDSF